MELPWGFEIMYVCPQDHHYHIHHHYYKEKKIKTGVKNIELDYMTSSWKD